MKDEVLKLLKKTLGSRKFWAAAASSVPFGLSHDWENFAMVWMAYAGIQGGVDAADKWKAVSDGPESTE